jgi:hypothetical protein
MSDPSHVAKSLRERFGGTTEERLGKALSDLLENPLLTGAIGRAFDAREKAVQAQEVAMGALNLPSAADIERLTRRLRSVSLRLEGIEEGVDRLDRTRAPDGGDGSQIAERLTAIEDQLKRLTDRLDSEPEPRASSEPAKLSASATPTPPPKPAASAKRAAKPAASAKPAKRRAKPAKA